MQNYYSLEELLHSIKNSVHTANNNSINAHSLAIDSINLKLKCYIVSSTTNYIGGLQILLPEIMNNKEQLTTVANGDGLNLSELHLFFNLKTHEWTIDQHSSKIPSKVSKLLEKNNTVVTKETKFTDNHFIDYGSLLSIKKDSFFVVKVPNNILIIA